MIKIGLTGGIGSGKSTVSSMIREIDIPVIDADIISREVMNIYPEIKLSIERLFGINFFDNEGNLIRRKLGNYIFANKEKKELLEKIIIPYINKEINLRIIKHKNNGDRLVVIDAPTLIEQDMQKDMDTTILVWVPMEIQIERVMIRDSLNRENTINRIKSQMLLDDKKEVVDYIINNSEDLVQTKIQLNRILDEIKTRFKEKE
ncbi:dephospho-CoA kinase [Clostridium sp. DL1XJH146]